jgi:hypothetical protein
VDARTARRAFVGALTAGLGADLLFDGVPLGINVPIMTLGTLALLSLLGARDGRRPGPVDRLDWWLAGVAATASLGPALRTDPAVVTLDLWLIAVALPAWGLAVGGVPVTRRATSAVAAMALEASVSTVFGLAWLLSRVGADGVLARGSREIGRAAPILRGLVIAVPILFGFTVLLGSADAVFGRAIDEALRLPDLDDLVSRALFVTIATVLLAGPVVLAAGPPGIIVPVEELRPDGRSGAGSAEGVGGVTVPDVGRGPRSARIGATEAVVVLLAVDVLFAIFAAIQVIYLFGGRDTLAVVGMTYSDYARQGYFQLVGVVALAGLLMIGAHEIAGRSRRLLVTGLALLVLTGVILASAALRLRLYQDAYGWTELRFFVAASIGWLAAAIAIAIALLVTNRMRWVAHGLAASAVVVTLVVSAIGSQAFVMEQNIARVLDPALVPEGGHTGFDLDYGLTLGDDAIPALVAALDRLPDDVRARALYELGLRRTTLESYAGPDHWQAWNLSRERAREALLRVPARTP